MPAPFLVGITIETLLVEALSAVDRDVRRCFVSLVAGGNARFLAHRTKRTGDAN